MVDSLHKRGGIVCVSAVLGGTIFTGLKSMTEGTVQDNPYMHTYDT